MKRLILLFAVMLLLVFSFYSFFSFDYVGNAETVVSLSNVGRILEVFVSNDETLYILSDFDKNYKIISVDKYKEITENILDISVEESTYAFCNKKFYFFINQYDSNMRNNNILIQSYDCETKIQKSKVINNEEITTLSTFAVDKNNNYYILTEDNSLKVFSKSCELIYSEKLNYRVYNMTVSRDGSIVFISGSDGLLLTNGSDSVMIDIFSKRIIPECRNCFSDGCGSVYIYNDLRVEELSGGFDFSNGIAVTDNFKCGLKNGCITAVCDDGEFSLEYAPSNTMFRSQGNTCVCVIPDENQISLRFIDMSDIEDVKNKIETNKEDTEVFSSKTVSSDIKPVEEIPYLLDNNNFIISGIETGTTAAQFKKNMKNNTIGKDIKVYSADGTLKTSGNIGTGMTFEYDCNVADFNGRYTIIVYGDVSSEGNINQNDKKILTQHLLGKSTLKGSFAQAADVNGDGKTDLKDLAALDEYIQGQYVINQKR